MSQPFWNGSEGDSVDLLNGSVHHSSARIKRRTKPADRYVFFRGSVKRCPTSLTSVPKASLRVKSLEQPISSNRFHSAVDRLTVVSKTPMLVDRLNDKTPLIWFSKTVLTAELSGLTRSSVDSEAIQTNRSNVDHLTAV